MIAEQAVRRIAGILSLVGIVTMPLHWIPLVAAGGIVLEVPNAVSGIYALILPLAILISRRMWRIHLLFGTMILWSALYFVALLAHNTPDGIGILRQQLTQAAFGWTLALCVAHSDIKISRIGLVSLIALGIMVYVSAARVGIDMISEMLNYLMSGDRGRFVYRALRPIFNAFVFTDTGDVTYLASLMNDLASSVVLFAILIFIGEGEKSDRLVRPATLLALAGMGFAFVIFSTSANLIILIFVMVMGYRVMKRGGDFQKLTIPLLLTMALIVIYGPMSDFISNNLVEDTASRAGRLGQYGHAMDVISQNVLFGKGFFLFDGLPVHNWPLFSWSAAGYLPFLVVLCVYALLGIDGMRSFKLLGENGALMLPLIAMLFVRTLFGGGGGVPSGSSMVAIAVVAGLLERQRRAPRRKEAPAQPRTQIPAPASFGERPMPG